MITLEEPQDPPANASAIAKKKWEIKIQQFYQREQQLSDSVEAFYAVVWGQCTESMRAKLRGSPNFITIQQDQDLVGLLNNIKGLSYKFDKTKYSCQALADLNIKIYKFYQLKDISTADYYEQFNSLISVLKHYGGKMGNHAMLIQE